MSETVPVRRALLSVSDKRDLVPFARKLVAFGAELVSTGGTANTLRDAGLPVTPIDKVTDFPEMMDGRVKTLHPRIHGGLLALRDEDAHVEAMRTHGIEPIDLVCVNLYPFEDTVARDEVTDEEAIEQIDIGGPSMVRSAAKNHRFVAVVTSPTQYDRVTNDLDAGGGSTSMALRRWLASEAFARTAAYDTVIANWMIGRRISSSDQAAGGDFPERLALSFQRAEALRYGENPHQSGALYVDPNASEPSVAKARQLHGIPLGFCNYYDANGALELVKEIAPEQFAAASVIKHANPCGFAIADDLPTAFEKAYAGDPLAAFGGIVALNRHVELATAEAICAGKKFLHVIIAPSYDDEAAGLLGDRWKDVRVLEVGPLTGPGKRSKTEFDLRSVTGGLLVQERDLSPFDPASWRHVAGPAPTEADLRQLALAMITVKHLKSNAVCIVNDNMLVGGGMGQVDRQSSSRLAVERAGERACGGYAASDAFFPFGDGPQLLIDAGVKAIVQPGGSKKDDEVIEVCNAGNATLMFTGRRHFRH